MRGGVKGLDFGLGTAYAKADSQLKGGKEPTFEIFVQMKRDECDGIVCTSSERFLTAPWSGTCRRSLLMRLIKTAEPSILIWL